MLPVTHTHAQYLSHVWGSFSSAQVAALWEEWTVDEWTVDEWARLQNEYYCLFHGLCIAQIPFSLISAAASLSTVMSLPWPWEQLPSDHRRGACVAGGVTLAAGLTRLVLLSSLSCTRPRTFKLRSYRDTGLGKGSPFSLILTVLCLEVRTPWSNVF